MSEFESKVQRLGGEIKGDKIFINYARNYKYNRQYANVHFVAKRLGFSYQNDEYFIGVLHGVPFFQPRIVKQH